MCVGSFLNTFVTLRFLEQEMETKFHITAIYES